MYRQEFAELFVEKLQVICILGDLPHERTEPQAIEIDLWARLDLSKCKLTDQLEDSVDYVALSEFAVNIALEGQYRLVEALAAAIAEGALGRWAMLSEIQVKVSKFGCVPNTTACGIVVRYKRAN